MTRPGIVIICLISFILAITGIVFGADSGTQSISHSTITGYEPPGMADVSSVSVDGILDRAERFFFEKPNSILTAFYICAVIAVFSLIIIWSYIRSMRKKKRQLDQTKRFYRLIMDNSSEGIMMVVSGKLVMMNRRASQLTGYFPHELTPRVLAELVDPKDRSSVKEIHRKIIRSQLPSFYFPFRIHCKNGENKWLANNSVRIIWNNIPGILYLFSDITENKKLEQQFLQAQKMEAIGQLAGGIAHDFNNILTAISGYGNLLRIKTKDDPAINRYARNILACSDRASNLVKSLLAFSRKQSNDPRPTDLHDIIQSAEKMLRHIVGEHIELSFVFSKISPVILADSNHIVQVLANLAGNARDAVKDSGKVTIRTSIVDYIEEPVLGIEKPKEMRYAVLTFEDTGIGITENVLDKIFDPFFTTKPEGKSSGLGLGTIFGIIKQQKGFIAVQTLVGLGTRFNIYFPVIEMPAERMRLNISHLPPGNGTILVCEDEVEIRQLLREILESNGYTVIEAKDGQEGINSFRENIGKIDLVLLDVMMPKKSGKDVYDTIIKLDPLVKTLFMTGYASETLIKAGFNEMEKNCLFKPIETGTLLSEIRKRLEKF